MVPGAYSATSDQGSSAQATVRIVPQLTARFLGRNERGAKYELAARVVPASAGLIAVRVTRGRAAVVDRTFGAQARIRLDTRRAATYRVRVALVPNGGYDRVVRVLTARVALPRLSLGSHGADVAQLGAQLRQLHYAAPVTATFDSRLLDSVYAFEKVQGLARTGIADARFWQRLAAQNVINRLQGRAGLEQRSPLGEPAVQRAEQLIQAARDYNKPGAVPRDEIWAAIAGKRETGNGKRDSGTV